MKIKKTKSLTNNKKAGYYPAFPFIKIQARKPQMLGIVDEMLEKSKV